MTTHAYRDRPLTEGELEMLRLALSSFRDGSGQNNIKGVGSMPGYRDYERSLAAVVGGMAPENKGVFDVVVPADSKPFGISCKMASTPAAKHLSSFMEMSNSAAKFRDHLLAINIIWATEPSLAGRAIVDLVTSWHTALADVIDLASSRYSVLAHASKWTKFRILCFPLDLRIMDPKDQVDWKVEGASLNGYMDDDGRRHRLWQYYPNSGGQVKYYPLLSWADWITPVFQLEIPPIGSPLDKARRYFPQLWPS